MNIFDELRNTIEAAKSAQRAVDDNVHEMACLIAGRLRSSGDMSWRTREALCRLKRELRDFDIRTGRWMT